MKALFILFCSFFSFNCVAQDAFFVDKKGNKTVMQEDQVEIILRDKRISYKQIGKTWEKYVRFKDLDYAKWGNYIFKTFNLKGRDKDLSYFLTAETKTHKLLTITVVIETTSSTGFVTTNTHYVAKIIDNDNNVLEDFKFTPRNRHEDERARMAVAINKYFADCPKLLGTLNLGGQSEQGIFDIMEDPEYINCLN